ncbi:MAG: aminoglycoside phosphotransferase family protein [Anaerolineales bacterium]|nr:aminoglycoside phosphotransferase family protein [Anaerolineales bacterium]
MLEKPDFKDERLLAYLRREYGLPFTRATLLPLGADFDAAVYQLAAADGRAYFLKLRRGLFADISVSLPRFLHDQGIREVTAPLPTRNGGLWGQWEACHLVLYPFVEGQNGFETSLQKHHWVAFGTALKRIHHLSLPPNLQGKIRRETYSPQFRQKVLAYQSQIWAGTQGDPLAARLATLLKTHWQAVHQLIDRAAQIGAALQERELQTVLCHADLHAGNLLVGPETGLVIVDWEAPLLAPKERDLMFIGAGVGGVWNRPQESAWFYQGYGPVEIHSLVLAYYRCERIVEDIAVTCDLIFQPAENKDNPTVGDDREEGLAQLKNQFLPNNVVEIAQETYRQMQAGRLKGHRPD